MIRAEQEDEFYIKYSLTDKDEDRFYFKMSPLLINYMTDGNINCDGDDTIYYRETALLDKGDTYKEGKVIEVIPEKDYYKYPMIANKILDLAKLIKAQQKEND